jgi:hypothetical protein
VRSNLLSLEATRKRHVGTSPDPAQYDPDLWVDECYFLNQPRQADIQLDLFYDDQNNLKSYPKWQQWLRDAKPPLLVLWGRYDTSFTVAGGEAYKKDDPRAEVHTRKSVIHRQSPYLGWLGGRSLPHRRWPT